MNGADVGLSPTPRASGTEGRLGLMLTELRLPTIKRLVVPLCAQSDREGWPGHRLLEALLEHEMTERQTRRIERHRAESGWRADTLGEHQLSVESCDNREQELRRWLQERIDTLDKRLARLTERIAGAMRGFKEEFKAETVEMDVSLAALPEYRRLLTGLQSDDLPQFEARFKELLNVNTINEIANFNAQLAREREAIEER